MLNNFSCIWVLQCSQSSRHVDSGAQVMSCSAICVMCLCSDFADGMWWRDGIIICFTQCLAQECGHNHKVGDGKKTGKFLGYAFRGFVFCLHFTLDKHTGWDGLDIASDPFRFKFCWWKGSRIQQNEQQIQWIYHCFVGIYLNCWQETFEKPLLFLVPGWLVFYQGSWSKCVASLNSPRSWRFRVWEIWPRVVDASTCSFKRKKPGARFGEIFPVEELGEGQKLLGGLRMG